MGCWNHSCALTNLPISAGEEVYVFLLKQRPINVRVDHCYPTTYWQPYGLFFEGEYNDYGAVENCKGDFLPLILEDVRDRLVETDVGENEYHDIAVKKEGFDVDALFDADHEDRLFVTASEFDKQYYNTDKSRIKHIVVRKNVLDMLLDRYIIERYEFPTGSKTRRVKTTFKGTVTKMYKHFESLTIPLDGTEDADLDINTRRLLYGLNYRDKFSSRVFEEFRYDCMIKPETVWSLVETQTKAVRKKFAKQVVTWYWLSAFMNDSRKMWTPPSGMGSQNTNTNAQRVLAHITIDEAIAYEKQWDE